MLIVEGIHFRRSVCKHKCRLRGVPAPADPQLLGWWEPPHHHLPHHRVTDTDSCKRSIGFHNHGKDPYYALLLRDGQLNESMPTNNSRHFHPGEQTAFSVIAKTDGSFAAVVMDVPLD